MLDVTAANQSPMSAVGKTRNERLADRYLEASGIAGVWIGEDGDAGALHVVTIDRPAGRSIYCVADFADAFRLARECFLYREMSIEHRAEMYGIGLTAHADVVARALSAVDVVNGTIRTMQRNGDLKAVNSAFKARRRQDPWLRYQDFLHAHKEQLLEVMARETRR